MAVRMDFGAIEVISVALHLLIVIPVSHLQVNVAVNQNASQHTTLVYPAAGQPGSFEWTADRAVDGCLLRDDPETQQCCSATTDDPADNYWAVTLAHQYEIEMIKVYARTDQLTDNQLEGFQLYLSEVVQGNPIQETQPPSVENNIYTFTFSPLKNVSVITIRRPTGNIIVLCEVQAFTASPVCDDGFYGPNCTQECGRCLDYAACDKTTGVCPEECGPGSFGEDCAQQCGKCQNDEICKADTGFCPSGCASGLTGEFCTEECENGKFGADCSTSCYCKDGLLCNKTTGQCPADCEIGYSGEFCHLVTPHSGGNFVHGTLRWIVLNFIVYVSR